MIHAGAMIEARIRRMGTSRPFAAPTLMDLEADRLWGRPATDDRAKIHDYQLKWQHRLVNVTVS